jgi:hypothetical protein
MNCNELSVREKTASIKSMLAVFNRLFLSQPHVMSAAAFGIADFWCRSTYQIATSFSGDYSSFFNGSLRSVMFSASSHLSALS